MYCKECGQQFPPEAKYCRDCGSKLEADQDKDNDTKKKIAKKGIKETSDINKSSLAGFPFFVDDSYFLDLILILIIYGPFAIAGFLIGYWLGGIQTGFLGSMIGLSIPFGIYLLILETVFP
ncbi:MAG: hypothetical protein ABEK59_11900 [Halobacteria archaeon]